nr:hypothetical protein [Tanacetum cinerariifolium]
MIKRKQLIIDRKLTHAELNKRSRDADLSKDKSADSRLKAYEEKVVGAARLEIQVSTLKKQVSGLSDKLASSDASFSKSKAKGKEWKKKIKPFTKSLDNLHAEVTRLCATLNQANVLEAEKDKEILRLKTTPLDFASFFCGQFQDLVWKFLASDEFSRVQANVPPSRDARVSLPTTKESTVTPASKSLELSANIDLTAFYGN